MVLYGAPPSRDDMASEIERFRRRPLVSVLVFGNTIDLMARKDPWVVLGMMQGLILATEARGQGASRR